jgi:hypothetical protein
MKSKKDKSSKTANSDDKPIKLTYPASEDIYARKTKADGINPDDNSEITEPNEEDDVMNEKSYDDELTGDDLDIPEAEEDNSQQANGSEDEENNYYSLPDNK